jgi:hypothetical protein
VKRNMAVPVVLVLASALSTFADTGKILKWDIEGYARNARLTVNAAVYYIQVGTTVYQVSRGTTKPEPTLTAGQQVECRIGGNKMFITNGGKELKFTIIGSSAQ